DYASICGWMSVVDYLLDRCAEPHAKARVATCSGSHELEQRCAMKALQLIDWKTDLELVEVPKPTPGPGEVVVKIGGAGACHSDLHLMHDFEPGMWPWKLPFTLGHENAGWVDSVGDGVTTVSEGDAVAVYGAWGCRSCRRCQQGFEN